MIRICQASIDENGHIKGGRAGDQTHKELNIKPWYSKPWTICVRHPNESIANKAANIAMMIAESNLCGYDQNERNTLHTELKKHNYDVGAYIASGVPTETDCSAFVTCAYIAAGVKTLEYSGNAPTTSTIERVFKAAGFQILTQGKYVKTDSHLKKGDLLVKPGSHVVIVCDSSADDSYYYPMYEGTSPSIVVALQDVGEKDTSKAHRAEIATVNGITDYVGTGSQNVAMLNLLKQGKLIKP